MKRKALVFALPALAGLLVIGLLVLRNASRSTLVVIHFSSDPDGATVEVDGRLLPGHTPLNYQAYVDASFTVTLAKEGYETWTRSLNPQTLPVEGKIYVRLHPEDPTGPISRPEAGGSPPIPSENDTSVTDRDTERSLTRDETGAQDRNESQDINETQGVTAKQARTGTPTGTKTQDEIGTHNEPVRVASMPARSTQSSELSPPAESQTRAERGSSVRVPVGPEEVSDGPEKAPLPQSRQAALASTRSTAVTTEGGAASGVHTTPRPASGPIEKSQTRAVPPPVSGPIEKSQTRAVPPPASGPASEKAEQAKPVPSTAPDLAGTASKESISKPAETEVAKLPASRPPEPPEPDLPPRTDQCKGEKGTAWVKRVSASECSFQEMDELRKCFEEQQDWPKVILVTDRLLHDDMQGRDAAFFYSRARAFYQRRGGAEDALACLDSLGTIEKYPGNNQCMRWRTQVLRIACTHSFLAVASRSERKEANLAPIDEMVFRLRSELDNVGEDEIRNNACFKSVEASLSSIEENVE